MTRPHPAPLRNRGFTLLEMIIASVLSIMLLGLLALTWASFGRSALEVEARARIAQEGILSAQALACDLGGFLADSPGPTGTLSQCPFVDWDFSDGDILNLNFQGPGNTIVISYYLAQTDPLVPTYSLVRSNSSTGLATNIARYVTAFTVGPSPDDSSQALIQITITYRSFTATYTLIGVPPS